MATTKDRINISVSKSTRDALEAIARRDQRPVATAAVRLLEEALELEEERAIEAIVQDRLKNYKKIKWVSHEEAWGLKKKKTIR
ncbi:MAG: hypothetical protein Q8R25_04815 [bacterium]|nr:hypothetical protein [bacterium]